MNDRDDTLSIPEYWEKHKFDIANMRHWVCQKYGCPEKRDNCECSCKLWEERYQRGNTLKTYSKYVANLTPFLTSPISEVTLFEIRDALICVKKSRKGGKPYSDSTMKVHFSCLCDIFLYAKKHGHADNILAVFASPKKMDPLTMRIYELVDPQNPQNSTLQSLEELHERVSNRPRSLTAWQKEKLIQKLCADIPMTDAVWALRSSVMPGCVRRNAESFCGETSSRLLTIQIARFSTSLRFAAQTEASRRKQRQKADIERSLFIVSSRNCSPCGLRLYAPSVPTTILTFLSAAWAIAFGSLARTISWQATATSCFPILKSLSEILRAIPWMQISSGSRTSAMPLARCHLRGRSTLPLCPEKELLDMGRSGNTADRP